MIYGYARVSTSDQSTEIQEAALWAAGADNVRAECVSGTSRIGRSELAVLLDFMRSGDVLLVTRVDRLARSIADLSNIVNELRAKNIELRAVEQPIDTGTPAGRAFLQMLGIFAEFETSIRAERQAEGIARAKKRGVYRGRPADFEMIERVFDLKKQGRTSTEIAAQIGISRTHVYRVLARQGDLLNNKN